jgi:lipopolysaccharide transport system permease protein
MGLYISPIGYSSRIIPEQWRLIYSLNPMAGIIDGFRWMINAGESPLYLSIGISVLLFITGFAFMKTEGSLTRFDCLVSHCPKT